MSRKKLIWIAAVIVAAGIGAWLWLSHSATEADDPEHAVAGDAVAAAVAKVERGPMENTLTIAGEFKPFQDVDVHAKVAGYIKKIYVDVGDHVKGGQTLAVLEVPELVGWSGTGGGAAAAPISPKAVIFTSLRYYLP